MRMSSGNRSLGLWDICQIHQQDRAAKWGWRDAHAVAAAGAGRGRAV